MAAHVTAASGVRVHIRDCKPALSEAQASPVYLPSPFCSPFPLPGLGLLLPSLILLSLTLSIRVGPTLSPTLCLRPPASVPVSQTSSAISAPALRAFRACHLSFPRSHFSCGWILPCLFPHWNPGPLGLPLCQRLYLVCLLRGKPGGSWRANICGR